MKKTLFFVLPAVFVLLHVSIFADQESPVNNWKPLDVGEPTSEEKSEMERTRQDRALENSGYADMEDLAAGSTQEEREFGDDEGFF